MSNVTGHAETDMPKAMAPAVARHAPSAVGAHCSGWRQVAPLHAWFVASLLVPGGTPDRERVRSHRPIPGLWGATPCRPVAAWQLRRTRWATRRFGRWRCDGLSSGHAPRPGSEGGPSLPRCCFGARFRAAVVPRTSDRGQGPGPALRWMLMNLRGGPPRWAARRRSAAGGTGSTPRTAPTRRRRRRAAAPS